VELPGLNPSGNYFACPVEWSSRCLDRLAGLLAAAPAGAAEVNVDDPLSRLYAGGGPDDPISETGILAQLADNARLYIK
jgi:hypothetical protein